MSENTNNPGPNPDDVNDERATEAGVGLGSGEPSTFEPEEDTEAVPEDPA